MEISQIHCRRSDFHRWISQIPHWKSEFQCWISQIPHWKSDFQQWISQIRRGKAISTAGFPKSTTGKAISTTGFHISSAGKAISTTDFANPPQEKRIPMVDFTNPSQEKRFPSLDFANPSLPAYGRHERAHCRLSKILVPLVVWNLGICFDPESKLVEIRNRFVARGRCEVFKRGENIMHDKQTAAPDSTAVRVALWRAMHVQIDPPPHVR